MAAPTDEDLRATLRRVVMGIPSMVTQALRGTAEREPTRETVAAVARIIRETYVGAVKALGKDEADEIMGPALQAARDRIVEVFGTSAWDEPAPPPPAAGFGHQVGMLPVVEPLLSDTQLDEIEAGWEDATVRRLCDNVRRLRGEVIDRDLLLLRSVEASRVLVEVLRQAGQHAPQLELVDALLAEIKRAMHEKGLPT